MLYGVDPAGLRACIARGWAPQIGDPEITGWLTVVSYLICFALACRIVVRRPAPAAYGLWRVLAVLMLVLAVNKQLDLQTALTATGRCLAQAQGWYDNRQTVQLAFILALLLAVSTALVATLIALRHKLRGNGLAILGMGVLGAFVMVRAVGFHHVDMLINRDFANVKFNFLFENAGLVLIAVNALMLLRRTR